MLFISDPPEIEVERSWVHSGEGYEAQLVCIVHGEPAPNVSELNFITSHESNIWQLKLRHGIAENCDVFQKLRKALSTKDKHKERINNVTYRTFHLFKDQ